MALGFAPLAIERGFVRVSRANAFGVSGRGNRPSVSSEAGGKHRGFHVDAQRVLAPIEDGVIEAVTRDGDKQFRCQGRTGDTS